MKRIVLITFLFLSTCLLSHAQSLQETRKLFAEKQYEQAKTGAEKLVKSSPSNGTYNYWLGACLFETGDKAASEKYLKTAVNRKTPEAYFYLGQLYFDQYLFEESTGAYTSYLELVKKDRKEEASDWLEKSKRASRLLKYTEDVQIIDSVVVDKGSFLQHYKLSEESGFITPGENSKRFIYTNQLQNQRYYAEPDTNNVYALYSQSKLIDKWGDQKRLSEEINSPEGACYPFVLNDGVTIYFAAKSNESIGGYDLFITRYNNNSDSYLAPEQLGMPFNSIYNDFMMAIDELNGIGYFASDRFQEEDNVIVYTFILNEEKNRVKTEDADTLKNRALITSIQDTWKEGQDYEALLQQIALSTKNTQKEQQRDFYFVINDNIIYYLLSDFESDAAKSLFLELQEKEKHLQMLNSTLESNRTKYTHSSSGEKASLKSTILQEEEQQIAFSKIIDDLSIQVRNTEIKHLRQTQQ